MATREELKAANARGKALREKYPAATAARFEPGLQRIVVELESGLGLLLDPRNIQGLERATAADLSDIEITSSGLGLYLPGPDVDLYVPGLLDGHFGSRKWAAARLGKAGGAARSKPKAEAARRNGALGGRPRKTDEDVATKRRK